MKEAPNDSPRFQVGGGQAGSVSFFYGKQAVEAPQENNGQHNNTHDNAQRKHHDN